MQLSRRPSSLLCLIIACLLSCLTAARSDSTPDLVVINPEWLKAARLSLAEPDSPLLPALVHLLDQAEIDLAAGPFTVMSKTIRPPSGDKHDYLSFGPYWWPDPEAEDGLPYIRRDGEVNPESTGERSDRSNLGRMAEAVDRLSLAWYFTGESRYADWAALLLHTWFLNPETNMNPNLDFGQAIPGITEGRGIGIIDTVRLLSVVDAAVLIEGSSAWTNHDHEGLIAWFREYLNWLRTSPNGIDESRTHNNHATWYDAQVAAFALFVGEKELARATVESVGPNRIAAQIAADGRQEHELARTKSFNYSTMNLAGFFTLARIGEKVGLDLWAYERDGTNLLKAGLDFVAPYADPEIPWPHEQISELKPSRLLPLLRQGFLVYDDAAYLRLIERIPPDDRNKDRSALLYPIVDATQVAEAVD